jgi:hypothetical protein
MTETMDGYIRISRRLGRKGAAYISPTVQREAIERWAEYRGVTILAWHTDEDESGGTHSRPGLDAARDRALNGETGGIVSWKIDRFSRFTEGGLRDLRLLEGRGARLAFVTEDIDTSGPMGKLVYTMLLAFAEFFLDNIKAGCRVPGRERAGPDVDGVHGPPAAHQPRLPRPGRLRGTRTRQRPPGSRQRGAVQGDGANPREDRGTPARREVRLPAERARGVRLLRRASCRRARRE